MIHSRKVTDVVAIKDNLVCQFSHVCPYLIMFDHYNYQVHIAEELVKVMILVLDYVLCNERVIYLKLFCQMLLLSFK